MRIAAGWMTKREKDPLLGRERSGPMKPAYLGESMPNLPSRAKKGSYNVAKWLCISDRMFSILVLLRGSIDKFVQ